MNPTNSEGEIAWTRVYSDDYWNDPVSPLFFELLGDQLTQIVNIELNNIMGYSKPGSHKTDKLLRLYHAHVYFNLEVLKKKVEYEIPPFLRSDDILKYFPEGSGPYGRETIKRMPFRLRKRILAEIRIMLYDRNGSVTRTASAYEAWTKEKFNPFWENFESRIEEIAKKGGNPLDYIKLAKELDNLMMGHFRLVRYGIPVHNIGMNLIAQYLLKRFLGEEEASKAYPVLISGLKHKTSETNERLLQLAAIIQASPRLRSIILETPSETLYQRLKADTDPETKKFMNELELFFKDFGARGFTREPYYPRWYEAPQYVFDILKTLVQDQNLTVKKNRVEELKLKKDIEQKIRSQPFGWLKWKLFSIILGFARTYIVFRENQRFNLDRWITMNRRIYLEIGKNFQKRGLLKEPQEIFFLRKHEIQKLASEKCSKEEEIRIRQLISQRKAEFLKYEHITPPKFLYGSEEMDDPEKSFDIVLHGIPASGGIYTGRVRVLDRVENICQVRSGEILVVSRTDPGWTPVFSKIGGLITETGGVLSHGAVVSREYGIPAVTNVQNACQILRTGQIVMIDGFKGIVRIIS